MSCPLFDLGVLGEAEPGVCCRVRSETVRLRISQARLFSSSLVVVFFDRECALDLITDLSLDDSIEWLVRLMVVAGG